MTIEECQPGLEMELAELRARAMKPSLEKVGRYDEKRVRDRLLDGFDSKNCRLLKHDNKLIGFFYIIETENEIHLKHLYIDTDFQNLGFGKQALKFIISKSIGKTLKLNALKESPSNSFYKNHGFQLEYEDNFDNYYKYRS